MQIAVAGSTETSCSRAVGATYEHIVEQLGGAPHLLLVYASVSYDCRELVREFSRLAPGVPLQGCSSCMGALSSAGLHQREGFGLGVMGLRDPEGAFGAGSASGTDDVERATQLALERAMEQAGRPGEVPGAVLMNSVPGAEERVIQTVEEYFNADIPIVGGTSADNDMSGAWLQFANGEVQNDGVSIAVLHPTCRVGTGFQGGYEPVGPRATVTKTVGRVIAELDGRRAADVYNEWTDGLISHVLGDGGGLVPTTSLRPLGRSVEWFGGVPYYRLSYVTAATAMGGLELFTGIEEGDQVHLMCGTTDSLVNRAGRVVLNSLAHSGFQRADVIGVLMFYCTGCMLVVQDRLDEVRSDVQAELGDAPFLTAFTLGEQGGFTGGKNHHGNLMIASLVFAHGQDV